MAKSDDLSRQHLQWLVKCRAENQNNSLRLFILIEDHKVVLRTKKYSKVIQKLVSISFSLWRSAFLADREGTNQAAFDDAFQFLGKLITDNAINYAQDRNAREWTFNYYMEDAKDGLMNLSEKWPEVKDSLSQKRRYPKGTKPAHRRWMRHQCAFETALNSLTTELTSRATK